jgi:hypothetical protein
MPASGNSGSTGLAPINQNSPANRGRNGSLPVIDFDLSTPPMMTNATPLSCGLVSRF